MLLARRISMQVSCNYRCKTHIILVRADNKLTAHWQYTGNVSVLPVHFHASLLSDLTLH